MDAARAASAALLAVGIGLLLFTFYCAYLEYLSAPRVEIEVTGGAAAEEAWAIFTQILPYLIEPCIKVMFLGVMGWAGVVLTSRGVQLLRATAAARAPAPPPAAPAVPILAPVAGPPPQQARR